MKLGLLLCDHVREELQGEFGDYPKMFKDLLHQVDNSLEIEVFDVIAGELPSHVDQCDVYITSGSRYGVRDGLAWVDKLSDFIRQLYDAKKGFVGICFGHQLIAQALGGEVNKSDKGWGIGIAFSHLSVQKDWMTPHQSTLDLVVSHQDQISRLPQNSEILLSNAFCPYAMVQVGEHFLGIQGHPEFSRGYSLALMNSRKDRIPADVIASGAATLEQQTDALVSTQWILNFLRKTISTNKTGAENMKAVKCAIASTLLLSLSNAALAVEGLSANVAATSDYMWRGMTQNNHDNAISGGIDYTSESGFYVGTWVSNVDFGATDATNYELDFYGGYQFKNNDVEYNFGYILYSFPDSEDINMGEVYASVAYKNLSLKVSTIANSDNNAVDAGDDTYIEAAYKWDLGNDLAFTVHAGSYSRESADNYVDYSATLSKGNFSFSVMDVTEDSVDSDMRVVVSYTYGFDL